MRQLILLLSMLLFAALPAVAQVGMGVGIGLPSVNIGINLPVFPEFAPVPGYPVYYAPDVEANYFFYEGMYWVYQGDNWYASSWYNGPWAMVSPMVVPVYILQVPVSYYRQPPVYFRAWPRDAPPRWGEHWGQDWQRQRGNWDQRSSSTPAPAPLPTYQRQYSGSKYPSPEEQRTITAQNYHYQPHDPVVRQHYEQFVHGNGGGASFQRGQSAPQRDRPQAVAPQTPAQPGAYDRPASPPADRPPSAQVDRSPPPPGDRQPRQPETAGQERRGPEPADNGGPRQERKDQNRDGGGDKVQEKELPRDNR